MIIKTLSRKSNAAQLITYATRYLVKDGKQVQQADHMKVLVEHNLRSSNVEDYIKAFNENESYRIHQRKDNAILMHTVLSFSPEDKAAVSLPILSDIAQKFIELRGTNCLHLAVAHLEKEHAHIHVITSGVAINGYSSRLSQVQFKNLLTDLEAYQQTKYPELIHSLNRHDKTGGKDKELLIEHFTDRRKTTKLMLHNTIQNLLQHSPSYDLFSKQLAAQNYELYYRNGLPQGVLVHNTKYRFSSIGIEPNAISELQQHDTILQQLHDIREKGSTKQHLLNKETMAQKQELQSLQSVRDQHKDFEGFERDIEIELAGYGAVPRSV